MASLSQSTFTSATLLISLQASTRIVTFVLNQSLLRLSSPAAYGTASIQFELILSTILFLAREGVRGALLRARTERTNEKNGKRDGIQRQDGWTALPPSIQNLTFLPFLLGLPLALITALVYHRNLSLTTQSQPHFDLALGIYVLAAIIELCTEPMHIRSVTTLQTAHRVRAEGTGVLAKSFLTFLVLFYDAAYNRANPRFTLVAFAVGQLSYALVVLGSYLRVYGLPALPRLGIRTEDEGKGRTGLLALLPPFHPPLLHLSLTLTSQSLLKHLLTEADKLFCSMLSPLEDQGGYAVAVNYGSLLARIVFQPIEESLRLYFSKILSPSQPASATRSAASSPSPTSSALHSASHTLYTLLHLQCVASVLLLAFAPPYLPLALNVLLPPRYLATSAPEILQAYVWYIPVLALNGGLEAFVASVANVKDVNRQSRYMILFSTTYLLTTLLFYRAGLRDLSLIYANIVSLLLRILYALHFSSSYFTHHVHPLSLRTHLHPGWSTLFALVVSAMGVRFVKGRIGLDQILAKEARRALIHPSVVGWVGFGGICAVACVGVWWWAVGRQVIKEVRKTKVQ